MFLSFYMFTLVYHYFLFRLTIYGRGPECIMHTNNGLHTIMMLDSILYFFLYSVKVTTKILAYHYGTFPRVHGRCVHGLIVFSLECHLYTSTGDKSPVFFAQQTTFQCNLYIHVALNLCQWGIHNHFNEDICTMMVWRYITEIQVSARLFIIVSNPGNA